MNQNKPRTREELQASDRKAIRDAVTVAVESIASLRSICAEAVANEAFYLLQRHPSWGRNATPAQKRASFKRWRQCHRCGKDISFEEAKFHHLKRGVPAQHGTANLVPEHLKCHDSQHTVDKGSLSKGAPERKRRRRP